MRVGDLCNGEVVIARTGTPVVAAARLMREHHVGSLIIISDRPETRVPVGMLTDRDIVVAVVAKEIDPRGLTVDEIMSADVLTAHEDVDSSDALRMMRQKGVRRLPIVGQDGGLVGILTLEDILELAGEEIANSARIPTGERAREATVRR